MREQQGLGSVDLIRVVGLNIIQIVSVNVNQAVILSEAKDLRPAWREILRCTQDDRYVGMTNTWG